MTARDAVAERRVLLLALMVGGLSREGAEMKVAAFETAHRAVVLDEAAAFINSDDTCGCGGCDTCQPRKLANQLRGMADATTPTSKEQQR